MMDKKFLFCALGTAVILLVSVFAYFPTMGHDYSFVVPDLIDLNVSWKKYGVLNPHFSAFKCLGTPVWARPVGFSLSILHLLTIISNDLIGIIIFIVLVSFSSFWGAYRLSLRMQSSHSVALYLAAGWTLQGWMIMRASVGHIMYISVGWFPLILYLLLKQKSKWRDLGATLLAAILVAQFVYLGAPYAPFMMAMSFFFLIPIILYWKQTYLFSSKTFALKLFASGLISGMLVLPKVLAISDLMASFPRNHPLSKIGFPALPYSFLNLFSFWPHDYKTMVNWWYGNWESIQFMFPLLLISLISSLVMMKEKKLLTQVFATLSYLLFISFAYSSGVLSDVFQSIPFFRSMHVNPRWNIVIALPLFVFISILMSREIKVPKVWMNGLLGLVYLIPLFHLSIDNLNMNYIYRGGYDEKTNRMSYCYEPIFGYYKENYPLSYKLEVIDFLKDEYLDPRCYLPEGKCRPGKLLRSEDKKLLESYRLR